MGKKGRNRTAAVAQTFDASPQYSISDPALAEFLGLAGVWGAEITEQQALSLTAVHRAQSLISGTIAGLPLKVYEGIGPDRHQVPHFWNPGYASTRNSSMWTTRPSRTRALPATFGPEMRRSTPSPTDGP